MPITKNVVCRQCRKLIPLVEKEDGDSVKCTCGYVHVVQPLKPVKEPKRIYQPEGTVEKVCPSCNSHIFVDPEGKEGSCSECGAHFYISRVNENRSGHGIRHGISLTLARTQTTQKRILSYLEKHPGCYKTQISFGAGINRSTVFRTISKLVEEGKISENRVRNKIYVEVVA